MKKKTKNKLDEMQEQKMLKIEHNGCWLAFWGMFAALMVQVFVYGTVEWRYVAGEWIVFMCLAAYICVACMKNGIWDRRLSPTPIVSLFAGIVAGILNFSITFKKYQMAAGAAASGIFSGLLCFALCFAGLMFCMAAYKKRVAHLEREDADEEKQDRIR